MHEQIRRAFGQIHAEQGLKERTLAAVEQKLSARKRHRTAGRSRLVPALACLVLLLVGGGWWAYFTPTAAVSIDVNPALRLEINRFDRVISAQGLNREGQALADELELEHLSYDAAVRRLLDSEQIAGLLQADEELTIAVSGSSRAQCSRLLDQASACAGERPNVHCYGVSQELAQAAARAGLPVGKYRAYLELQELDPSVTPDDVRELTVGEIRELIRALQGGRADPSRTAGSGQGNQAGGSQGSGNGQRNRGGNAPGANAGQGRAGGRGSG